MIEICKLPIIIEDTDRWGQPLGTYSVQFQKGKIDEDLWKDLKFFESYNNTDIGKKEMEALSNFIKNGGSALDTNLLALIPEYNRLLSRARSTVWQFNALVEEDPKGEESRYIRMYGCFNNPQLYEFNPSIQMKYIELVEKCKKLNDVTV